MVPVRPTTFRLTGREIEILKLIAASLSAKQIALTLGITSKTVSCHRAHLMAKLDIHETAGLVRFAVRHRYIVIAGPKGPADELEVRYAEVKSSHAAYRKASTRFGRYLKESERAGLNGAENALPVRQLRRDDERTQTRYRDALRKLHEFLSPPAAEA